MNHDSARQIYPPFLPLWLRERIGSSELRAGMVCSGEATILYADMSGFTWLTAAFASLPDGAERLHDTLNRCYVALIETIGAYGGDVASIAGDALMAWWPDQIDMELGRRCAQALLAAVAALPTVNTPTGPFSFALRIGVSAGPVHITLVGLPTHGLHFVLLGPAVVAATAAERSSATGTCLLVEPKPAEELVEPLPLADPASEPPVALSWEHFISPTFVERLRQNDLSAEYRRCIPAFVAFDLPPHPQQLHPLVAQVQTVVRRWGGWLNEVEVGDKGAVMVLLFGAPISRGDDSSRAVGCCLELCERKLVARAGITLGWLFVGTVGSPERRVYTAQGDDMNLAAHLMQQAPPGVVLISGRVRNDVLGRYVTTNPSVAITKGHSEGVPVAQVVPASAGAGRRDMQRGRAVLPDVAVVVGRLNERQRLAQAAETAAAGRPTLILVEGESGIGKSCLLQELFTNWCDHGRAGYSAECSSGELSAPLTAWRTIVLSLCGIDEGEPTHVQQSRLTLALARLPTELLSAAPLLAHTLGVNGVRPETSPPLLVEDENSLVALAAALVISQARGRPLLIVLEDIHWADQPSLWLALTLLHAAPPGLCLVLSHRPLDGRQPPPLELLRAHAACVQITVGRLSSAESTQLICAQLGVDAVDSALSQHVERHTEGQPLFIKEYLRVLRQQHLVDDEGSFARLARPYVNVQVSSSAQGVIQARVDRLDPATRLTLRVAAVLGQTFQLRLLSVVHPAHPSAGTLDEQLETLVSLQIIDIELEGPERVYRFKHGVGHEVAYRSLLFGQRRELHAAVARWYESAYADEIAGGATAAIYDQLIRHLGHAEEWDRQAYFCLIAARQATHHYNINTALRYIEQGLVFVKMVTYRFELLLLRVALNERAGNYVSQLSDLDLLDELAPQLGAPLQQAQVAFFRLRFLLATRIDRRSIGVAAALLRQLRCLTPWLSESSQAELALLRAACIEAAAAAHSAIGERRAARRLLNRALVEAQLAPLVELGLLTPQHLVVRCLNGLGTLELTHQRLPEALHHLRQALDVAVAIGDWSGETSAQIHIGEAHLLKHEDELAFAAGREALAKSSAVLDRVGQVRALRLLAAVRASQGRYTEVERDGQLAATYCAGARARALEVQIWEDLAGYAAAQGSTDSAEEARQEAKRLRRQW